MTWRVIPEWGVLFLFTSLTVSEMFPNFFLRTSEVFTVSDSIVFWEKRRGFFRIFRPTSTNLSGLITPRASGCVARYLHISSELASVHLTPRVFSPLPEIFWYFLSFPCSCLAPVWGYPGTPQGNLSGHHPAPLTNTLPEEKVTEAPWWQEKKHMFMNSNFFSGSPP